MTEAGARPRLRVVAAVVWDGPRLLLTQRPPGGALGLQWEFPGGKLEPGESPEAALVREVHEELGVDAIAHETLRVHAHDYPGGPHVDVIFIRCTLASTAFTRSDAVHAFRWMEPQAIDVREVLAADRDFLVSLGAPGAP